MTKSYSDILREARAEVREVSTHELDLQRESTSPPLVVDVRENHEWEAGHLPGAIHVPRSHLESLIEGAAPDRSRPVVLYCASGVRSVFASKTLGELGYTNVASMAGGFQAWKSQGLPWEMPTLLSAEQ
ncbi:MAG: rhodanese-like domain-containing protein, partial [Candidatus Limnocylindrales bacterium]